MVATLNLTQAYGVEMVLPELMFDEIDDGGSDPLLAALPLDFEDTPLLKWDQCENGYGLLSLRGLGGEVPIATIPGARQYAVRPGYYGERAELEETELTESRDLGTAADTMDPAKRVAIMMQYQADKGVSRIRQTIADLLLTGKFVNRSPNGAVVHADQIENYQVYATGGVLSKTNRTLGPGWASSPGTATPLTDMERLKLELEFGTSSEFGSDSTIVCNPDVIVDMLATDQIQKVYHDKYGASITTKDQLDVLMQGAGLPKLVPYKKGYFPTIADAVARTNFSRIITSKSMIWFGTRPKGQKLGRFKFTRNIGLNSPEGTKDSPYRSPVGDKYAWANGIYVLLEYFPKMPFRYELDFGFNGGPVVHFGSAVAGFSYT